MIIVLNEWWEALSGLQKVFMFAAVPATLVLIIQTVLLLIGFGDDADTDIDELPDSADGIDSGPAEDFSNTDSPSDLGADLRIFTVRGIVAFFAIFGWTGIALLRSLPAWFAVVAAVLAGAAAMVAIAWLMKTMMKLQSSGNISPKNAVGKTGVVYVPIPAGRSGSGKVNLVVQERYSELEAVTDGEAIPTGREVIVVGNTTMGTLVVKEK